MATPMMKCGHSANATTEEGKPCCVVCIGIHPGAEEINDNPPSFEDRKAHCSYYVRCKTEMYSSPKLAFFSHKPDEPYDEFYCGCYGWD